MEDDHPRPAWPLTDATGAPTSTASAALRDELLAAYADPSRGHHDTGHLADVLDRLDELAAAGTPYDALPVRLAAWFHDSVYDGERDAEERSATWAEHALPGLVDDAIVAEVARLVRLTEHHHPEAGDLNGCALSDADLAVLASLPERYAAYVAAVRTEYAHLPDPVFRAGRRDVLENLVGRPDLFHTAHGTAHWEAAERANIDAELAALPQDPVDLRSPA